MPVPAGFQEEAPTMPAGFQADEQPVNMPAGFVPADVVTPEIRQAPQKGLFDKMIGFFRDPVHETAKAQNIYALSKLTDLPLQEVNRNYEILRHSSKVTGISPDVDNKQYMQMVMLPGIAASAVVNPIGTAAGLVAFGAVDKAIPTEKFINSLREKGVSDDALTAMELADFIGKGMIAGQIFHKAPGLAERFFKSKITEYKLPETISLSAEQVRDIYQTGTLTIPEQQILFGALELNSFDKRAAFEHGISINIPSEKVIRLVDKPLWAKAKSMFGVTPENTTATISAGEAKKAPAGMIEQKEGTPAVRGAQEPQKGDPVKNIISALKEAKSVRGEQETLYAKARAQKFAKMQVVGQKVKGEKGFYAQLGALKGELPRVEFEAIRGKLSQEDIDAVFSMVQSSPKIGEWEKITARQGLAKMFNEYGGKVPTEGEITLLSKVFGEEFTKAILEKRSVFEKAKDLGIQLANVPRSIMASFDLSAPLRQGVFLISRPKQFLPAFRRMFGAFKSKAAYEAIQDSIIKHPDFQLARDSNLSLTDMDVLMGTREEAFMSNLAEKIPLVGRGIKASERAYMGFLNKLRFDVFADLVNKANLAGLNPYSNKDLTKAIAEFVNNATGRGTLPGAFQKSAVALNTLFFSPRLMMSRLNLLNPAYYVKQKPFVRKEALKSFFAFVGLGTAVLTLAKLSGADVGADPRSSDFGKIKIGNTRVDIWGGFQQLARVSGQLISGKYISSTTGEEMTLGEGYKPMTRADIVQRFFEGKLAPIPSFVVTLMKGQDAAGKKVDVPLEVAQRFIPMILQDTYDILQEAPGLVPVGLLSIFGIGVQTYQGKDEKGF